MARRRPGVGGIRKDVKVKASVSWLCQNGLKGRSIRFNSPQEKFAAKRDEIADLQLSYLTGQLDTFRDSLEQFASKHKTDIRKNAEFRGHFQQMCARIGVDPLACEL